MDPFTIVTGSLGLADVCIRVTHYLKNAKAAAGKIAGDLQGIINEVDNLRAASKLIEENWPNFQHSIGQEARIQSSFEEHSELLKRSLDECRQLIDELEASLDEIVGESEVKTTSKLDGITKVFRLQSREKGMGAIRQRIWTNRQSLMLALQLVTLSFTRQNERNSQPEHGSSDEVVTQSFGLQQTKNLILSQGVGKDHDLVRAAIASAQEAIVSVSPNKYFLTPRAVSSLYIGRDHLLQRLKATILTETKSQKRFVVYGMGGSGKTQFCCKFAEEVKDSFWGIFCINARSPQTLQQTFSELAEHVGVAPKETAVKKWLANLKFPWLLFIDNADDKTMDLESYFPAGTGGYILVATRSAYHRTLGTVDCGFFDFNLETLGIEESRELLLKAADEKSRVHAVTEAATNIARHFGYLPLALVHAGKAIFERLCDCNLWNYLTVHDEMREKIRRSRSRSRSRSIPRSRSSSQGSVDDDVDPLNMNVFSSYEVLFAGLQAMRKTEARDAVDLLKLFSFLSNESLRYEVLLAAVEHAELERKHESMSTQEAHDNNTESRSTWGRFTEIVIIWIKRFLDTSSPVLPDVLKMAEFDQSRLTRAMVQLESVSLISYHQGTRSYSMHPLIHTWIRERPDMSHAEQALWCQAASSVLASSILLPPLNSIKSAEALQMHLLEHVRHVQECRQKIDNKLEENRQSRAYFYQKRPWDLVSTTMNTQTARELAKFSFIYVINGYYRQAEELLIEVRKFVQYRLGLDNPVGWRVTDALSNVYMASTHYKRAAELRDEMFNSCKMVSGERHPRTLKMMDSLGEARMMQGALNKARELHETALAGMEEVLSPNDPNIFIAKSNLGKCLWRFFEFRASHTLFREAWEGLRDHEDFGETHSQTLDAKENVAVTCADIPGSDLEEALALARSVKNTRKEKLGKDNPFTLLARVNIARIRNAMGQSEWAERILRKARIVADRDLDEGHFGVLMGKVRLADVLMCQGKYGEAEELLLHVTQPRFYYHGAKADGEHPDRIFALKYLVRCYREQAKLVEALEVCDQLTEAIQSCGGTGLGVHHPMTQRLRAEREAIEKEKEKAESQVI